MIGKDHSTKPVISGSLILQQNREKTQIPEGVDAGYFKQFTKAETNKNIRASETKVTGNDSIVTDDQSETQTFDASQTRFSTALIALSFRLPAISQFTERGFRTAEPTIGAVDESLRQKPSEIRRSKDFAAARLFVGGDVTASVKLPKCTHQDHENTGTKIRSVPAKPVPDLTAIAASKTGTELPMSASPQMVQIPPNVMPAQVGAVRTADLTNITHVQIEHVKHNSAGVLTSLELVLEPAELGRITARIVHEAGRVTLILNAEHKRVADDLAKDSGLLLRVLGDHLPNIDRMSVLVQTAAPEAATGQSQLFSNSSSQQNGQNGKARNDAGRQTHHDTVKDGNVTGNQNTTSPRIFV